MKKLGMLLGLLLVPVVVFATITSSQEFQLNRMNSTAQVTQLGTLLAKTPNVVVGKYSYAVQGGAVSDISLLRDLNDTHSTITLPSGAVVKQVYVDVLTTAAGGSVAVKAQTTADLVAAIAAGSLTGGSIKVGVPINTAATMIKLTADRVPKLSITNAVLTAGKLNVYIEYVLGD